MTACLDDFFAINRLQIEELQRIGDSFPDPNTPAACEAFTGQVKTVEAILRTIYGLVASEAKRASRLPDVAEIWSRTSLFCDSALQTLSSLKNRYPYCGTSELHNLALDYKSACVKRNRRVLEEIECQNLELPKGLFPERI